MASYTRVYYTTETDSRVRARGSGRSPADVLQINVVKVNIVAWKLWTAPEIHSNG